MRIAESRPKLRYSDKAAVYSKLPLSMWWGNKKGAKRLKGALRDSERQVSELCFFVCLLTCHLRGD